MFSKYFLYCLSELTEGLQILKEVPVSTGGHLEEGLCLVGCLVGSMRDA